MRVEGGQQENPLSEAAMFSFAERNWHLLNIIDFPKSTVEAAALSNAQTCAQEICTVNRQTRSEADTHSEWRSRGNTVYG